MIDPVEVLKAKKAKILADAQQQADAVDADVRELERLRSLAEKYDLVLIEKSGDLTRFFEAKIQSEKPIELNGAVYKAAINVSENAIRAARQPLELSVLFDACESAGVKLGGQRPQSTLSAYLSHPKSTVESIRKGLYWLKGVPRP